VFRIRIHIDFGRPDSDLHLQKLNRFSCQNMLEPDPERIFWIFI
jgi:hypothetical protein